MSEATTGVWTTQLAGLFDSGTCAGLSDGELLERFRTGRDEAGERAFETLVTRHGPMVLGICRKMLDDPSDVHDAFQAVFLVLARRAGAIRSSQSVGSWLYGVSVRLCARARAASIRRRVRDRRILAAAATAVGDTGANPDVFVERNDGARVVHEEVVRLPEPYRAPIVLCYFEGLTHDEAAARLSWPVGTVRSRLARARDRLRSRLARRGIAAPSSIGPMAAWLVDGPSPSLAVIRAAMAADLPANVPASLARAAVRLAAGQSPAVGAWSSASIAMADGVLKTMMLKKLAVAGALILSLGIGTGTGTLVIRMARGQDTPARDSTPKKPADKPDPASRTANSPATDPLIQKIIESARQRFDAQKAYYEEGRITIDRFIDASEHLQRAELLAAKDDAERMAIRSRHVTRLGQILDREQKELLGGRGTASDVAEAAQALDWAQFEMRAGQKEDAEKASLLRRIAELERKVEELQKERGGRGRDQVSPSRGPS